MNKYTDYKSYKLDLLLSSTSIVLREDCSLFGDIKIGIYLYFSSVSNTCTDFASCYNWVRWMSLFTWHSWKMRNRFEFWENIGMSQMSVLKTIWNHMGQSWQKALLENRTTLNLLNEQNVSSAPSIVNYYGMLDLWRALMRFQRVMTFGSTLGTSLHKIVPVFR